MQFNNLSYFTSNGTTTAVTTAVTIRSAHHIISNQIAKVATFFICTLVFLTGTLGNSLVVYVFGKKNRKERKHFDNLLLILAITDLLSSFVGPVLFIYGTITEFAKWHLGFIGCKLFLSLLPITVTFSHSILVLISFERYRAIKHPLNLPFKLKNSFIFSWLLVTLLLAMLLVSPYSYSLTITRMSNEYYGSCQPVEFFSVYIYTLGSLLRDIISTVAMIILAAKTTQQLRVSDSIRSTVGTISFNNANRARKMFAVLVFVFSICVVPADLLQVGYYTYFMINGDPNNNYNVKVECHTIEMVQIANTFLQVLQVSNSAWNVVIYSKMQKDIHRTLCLLCKKLTCGPPKQLPIIRGRQLNGTKQCLILQK